MSLSDEIVKSLNERPRDWNIDEYRATLNGIYIWIANGIGFMNIESPTSYRFSLFEQFKIKKALKKAKEQQLTERLLIKHLKQKEPVTE